ncbi:T9SS type A sorting domain-containing protein [Moheibacter stercoris]|uniref:Secretion system C-terminal sorting domain-containing protein n=1 Tax=Moheibacter stercoris TaxID=1628251 RepID=A0ABV2LV01_9FLAO
MRNSLLLRMAILFCCSFLFMVSSMAQIVTNQSRETIFNNTIFIGEPEYGVNNIDEGTLYSNGPFYNQPGTPNKSVLQGTDLLMTTYGSGHAQSSGFRVADDWVVANPVSVDSFQFYSYQTGSSTTSTINFLSLAIWNGVPGESGSSIVWGSQTTNAFSSSTWTGVYRVLDTSLNDTSRPIMITTVNTPGLTLEPGTYWLDWQTGGTLSSGPWAPPIAIWGMSTTGNAKQYDPATALWTNLEDVGPQGLPFEVNGVEILDGCTNNPNGQWPTGTFTPACAGTEQTITTAGYTGEISVVNVTEGNQYNFRVNNPAHFITITNSDNVILAAGTGTVNWTATMTGTIKFFHHLSSACDFSTNSVTRYVTCTPAPPTPCTMDTITSYPFTETFEQSSPSRQCWTNEHVSGTSDWTYAAGAAGGAITTAYGGSGLNARFQQANSNQDITKLVSPKFVFSNFENASLSFYYGNQEWIGDQNELRVYYKTSAAGAWTLIPGAEFTTNVNAWTLATFDLPESDLADEYFIAFEGLNEWGYGVVVDNVVIDADEILNPGCLTTPNGSWGSLTPACTGAPELITSIAYTGEYSSVTVTAGTEYIFSSSVNTDFITIANNAGTVAYAAGVTPVTWTATSNETIRFIMHNNSDCDYGNVSRSKFVQCGEPFVFDDPDYDCFQGDGDISALENGYGILATDIFRVADDFTVDPGTEFTLRQITMSFLSLTGVTSATVRIHEDASGFPGTEIENVTLTPTTNVEYGEAFGFTAHRVEFALATPITLGEGTYWLNVTTPNATYWVVTTSGTSGSVVALSNTSGATWVLDVENYRSVFYVEGDCTTVEPEEPCLDTPNGSWGSLTPACTGSPELVTSAAWTGEYSSITVTAGTEYIFSSSVNTDFITIANNAGTVAYAAGVTPVTWTATSNETIRFIMHYNSDCDYGNVSRSKFVKCGEPFVFDDPDYDCFQGDGEISALENGYGILESDIFRVADDFTVDPGTEFTLRQITMSFLSLTGVTSATVRIHEDASGFPGTEIENVTLTPTTNVEYGEAFGFTAHRVEFALATPITLGEGTYWLNVTTPNATYWVTTTSGTSGSVVALSNTSGASWVLDVDNYRSVFYVEGDCNDVATEEPCLDTPNGSWGSLTPACTGAPELITSIAYTGEYSSVTVTAGTEYIFSSSVNTDFITIANSSGTVAYAAGVTPLTWTATSSETIRFIMHNNSDCEYDSNSRSKFVQCGEIVPPPPYDPCAPVHEGVATNGVGFVNNGTDHYVAANDFNVLANTQFEVEKFTINVVTLDGEPTTFDISFYEGETGVGAQFGETLTSLTPSSITPNGTFAGIYPVYSVEFTLPNTVIFPATTTSDKKYWIAISGMPSVSGQSVYWVSSDYVQTDTLPTWQSANGGATWALFTSSTGMNVEGDLFIDGECATLGLSDMSGAKFAYYPNPVNDVLNITTYKGIEKVEVFNLAGQSVMVNGKVTNGQVNVSALTAGTYVFRVTLEGGQVETFKVIKKGS